MVTASQLDGEHCTVRIQHDCSGADQAIAPNPATFLVTMNMEGVGVNGGTLRVFDPLGRLVQQQMIAHDQQSSTLYVAEFTLGLYRIVLKTDHGMVTKTLAVVKE